MEGCPSWPFLPTYHYFPRPTSLLGHEREIWREMAAGLRENVPSRRSYRSNPSPFRLGARVIKEIVTLQSFTLKAWGTRVRPQLAQHSQLPQAHPQLPDLLRTGEIQRLASDMERIRAVCHRRHGTTNLRAGAHTVLQVSSSDTLLKPAGKNARCKYVVKEAYTWNFCTHISGCFASTRMECGSRPLGTPMEPPLHWQRHNGDAASMRHSLYTQRPEPERAAAAKARNDISEELKRWNGAKSASKEWEEAYRQRSLEVDALHKQLGVKQELPKEPEITEDARQHRLQGDQLVD
jgi:hypothetical protein